MIVGAGDEREVEPVRDGVDRLRIALQHVDPLGRAVRQLDRHRARDATDFVGRELGQPAGNGEHQDGRMRRVGDRIVPLALRVGRDGRIDAEDEHVLRVVARFERGEEDRLVRVRCIPTRTFDRARDALVVADVRDIEAGRRVPRAIARDGERAMRVPRVIRVTVEVDRDVVRIAQSQRRHGTRHDDPDGVDRDEGGEQTEPDHGLVHGAGRVPPRAQRPPYDGQQHESQKERRVLLQREQRERVQQLAYRREHRVGGGADERRAGGGRVCGRVEDRRRAHRGGGQHEQTKDATRRRGARELHGAKSSGRMIVIDWALRAHVGRPRRLAHRVQRALPRRAMCYSAALLTPKTLERLNRGTQ